ncbi:ABC transporter permease [Paenibacillus tengchongensis]|uniref:ABC transporter permease n=1 Tax=Paenibacillus tengchongensis TaxID=2608684 RepID=UPI001FE9E692|nr:ABC transporter permease [Paenibacillus tengchongensis]
MRITGWFNMQLRRYGPFIVLLLLILACWETAARTGIVPAFILPAPTAVWAALLSQAPLLLGTHLPATLTEALLGFALAAGGGTVLGAAMHLYGPLEKALYPLLIISQTIPMIALSPVFILWFGYTLWSKLAVVLLTAFFPVVVGTFDGLRAGGDMYKDLLLTLGAGRRQLFFKTQIPMALPAYFSGLKLCIVYCVIGATIGEWLGGGKGLGYYSRRTAGNLQSAEMFAAILLLALLGMALFLAMALLERIILKKRGLLL